MVLTYGLNMDFFATEDASILVLKPAKMSDQGTCTCHARGLGVEDSAEFTVGGAENKVQVIPKQTEMTCNQGEKKACVMAFDVTTDVGVGEKFENFFETLPDIIDNEI